MLNAKCTVTPITDLSLTSAPGRSYRPFDCARRGGRLAMRGSVDRSAFEQT